MKKAFSLNLLAVLSVGLAANAESITYTESATASGSLNGVSFTNALVTFTGTGDTNAVVDQGFGLFQTFVTVEGTVEGVGSFTVTTPTDFFSTSSGAVGVSGDLDILDTFTAALNGYELQSAIGPVTGNVAINPGHIFATSAGDFDLSSAGDSTFQATTGTAATPEPGSFALLGTGLLGFAGIMKRRIA